ncbi:MAG: amidohydrolase [Acidimicrobiia bacterium]
MTTPASELDAFLDGHLEELITFRRELHAHPELSGEEHETTSRVAERLRVAGLAPRILPCGTGLICDLPAARAGSGDGLVALRADLDALAMIDETTVPYRSQVPGVAHACGHDVHTTVVLGAGLALTRLLAADGAPPGSVRLLFEPAEESAPGGALDVIDAGGLTGVRWLFGLHCDPKLDAGQIGVRVGAITSAADLVTIRLHGPGGHTARPLLTVDLVAVAGRLAADLPVALRAADPSLNLVFGALHAGEAANVIPATAQLRGTLRTADRVAWDAAPAHLDAALRALVEPTGATFQVDHARGVPPVVNDEAATGLLAAAAAASLGTHAVVPTEQSAGGDDFAWYAEQVPSTYARLGVHDPESTEPRRDLHASTFDVDERAIAVGVRVLVNATLAALTHPT